MEQEFMASDQASDHEVRIPASKGFWSGWFAISSLSTVGLFLVGHPIGFFLSLVFGAHAAYALRKLTAEEAGLRITEEGVIDRSHWISAGAISWEEILDIRPTRWGMIEIELRDENAFWERLTPWQKLGRIKLQLYGFGPALLFGYVLSKPRAEIVDELQAGLDQAVLRSVRERRALPGEASPP